MDQPAKIELEENQKAIGDKKAHAGSKEKEQEAQIGLGANIATLGH